MKTAFSKKLSPFFIAAVCVLPAAVSVGALLIGRMPVSLSDFFSIFTGEAPPFVEATVLRLRLPRVLLALLVGAGLSVSGAAYQSLFRNPLATPDTLGVASGASFGAALAMLLGLSLFGIQLTAFLFGIAAVGLTYISGRDKLRGDLGSVVLSGIMIGSLFTALTSLIKFSADTDTKLPAITYFLMGNLGSASYSTLLIGAPPIIISILILLFLRWRLNLLTLDKDEATATGANVTLIRVLTVLCSTLITASAVSMCGQVGWVGLLMPHLCRMLAGADNRRVIPLSVSFGASFLVIADTAARSLFAAELPISVLTAVIGAPVFIILLRKAGRRYS